MEIIRLAENLDCTFAEGWEPPALAVAPSSLTSSVGCLSGYQPDMRKQRLLLTEEQH